MPLVRWSFVTILAIAASTPAAGQIPNLKKLKEAAKKMVTPVDTTTAKPTAPPPAQAPASQSAKVWENYDFVPGNKVIFFTDFSEDKVGNFARRLKFLSGSMDVVERDGVRMLRATARSMFLVPVGKQLPERFTLEIDILSPALNGGAEAISFEGGARMDRGEKSADILWQPKGTAILGSGQNMGNSPVKMPEAMEPLVTDNVAHIRVLMDGPYFKLYTNERRIYNIPELTFRRDSVIRVFLNGSEADGMAVYLAGIRVAESETDVLYDALAAKGRWSTQGILFATGKAELRPESRPVLKEIAGTLREHADLNILIEGHTDNVGVAAANLALSDARAAAVKTALVTDFAIGADRIITKGLGDTKPAVPNTTAEGRAQNRRVEVVKR